MPKLYGRRWERARARFLARHPLCTFCEAMGYIVAATVVDHIIPHKGDMTLFWDESNWQPLCKLCHDGTKKSQEATGKLRGCDHNGYPLDENHHWNGKGAGV